MKQDWQDFITERAEHLAFVHLTRRDDLVVERMTAADTGIHMLVTLLQHGLPTNRFFGVQAQAQDADRSASPTMDTPGDRQAEGDSFPALSAVVYHGRRSRLLPIVCRSERSARWFCFSAPRNATQRLASSG